MPDPKWESAGTFGNARDKCLGLAIKNKQIKAAIERDVGTFNLLASGAPASRGESAAAPASRGESAAASAADDADVEVEVDADADADADAEASA